MTVPDHSRRVTIVGLGATGQSLGLALRQAMPDGEIVGHDRDPDVARAATKAGAVSRAHWNLISACEHSALVLLALPTRECLATLEALQSELPPGTIVTDTAPLKLPLARWAAAHLSGDVHFVGGHPLAPVTKPDARAFVGSTYCLTPNPDTAPEAVESISRVVEAIGAQPAFLDPVEHDGLIWELEGAGALAVALSLAGLAEASGRLDAGWLAQAASADALALASRGEDLLAGVGSEADWHTARAALVQLRGAVDALLRRLDDDPSLAAEVADSLREGRAQSLRDRRETGTAAGKETPSTSQASWRRLLGMR